MEDHDPSAIDILEWLADATSKETLDKLLAAAGGTHVWVPENRNRVGRLVKIVGRDAAVKIRDAIGSGPLYIPMGHKRGPKARVVRIIQLTKQGRSVNEIASIVGTSARNVFRIRANHRARGKREAAK